MTVDMSIADPSLGPAGIAVPVPAWMRDRVRDPAEFARRMEAVKMFVIARAQQAQKRVLAESLAGLIGGNPVAQPFTWNRPRRGRVGGHSRRNWQVIPAGGQAVELEGVDPTGSQTKATGFAAIAALPLGAAAKIVNPTRQTEHLVRGWSHQAAPGWVDVVFNSVRAKYARVV